MVSRSWYSGKETLKDRLLELFEKSGEAAASEKSRTDGEVRDQGKKEAARIVREGVKALGLASGKGGLASNMLIR